MLKEAQRRELLGLALLALAVFLTLSLVPPSALGGVGERLFPSGNLMGVVGLVLAEAGLDLLGAGALLLPIVPALAGAASFGWMPRESAVRLAWLSAGLTILLPTTLAVLDTGQSAAVAAATPTAGWAGRMLRVPLVALFGWFGALFALAFLGLALSVATVGWNPARAGARAAARGAVGLRATLAQAWAGHAEARRRRAAAKAKPKSPGQVSRIDLAAVAATVTEPPKVERPKPVPAKVEKAIEEKGKAEPRKQAKAAVEHGPAGPRAVAGEHPPVELLSAAPAKDAALSEQELDRLGEIVVETLRTFKVEGRIVGRTTGPVVTQFEFVPAPGIKVNRIAALDADLALALKAPSVRIVAPIPGKGAVGVEVPNPEPEVVYLREILDAPAFQRSRGHLPIALGRDLTGRPYVADLTKMPHLLIAGTTGSGKSICINTLITSLCYRHSPRTLRFLLIDPKMVELSMYASLPHLRHPVVTDPRDAATVLKWAVLEMERRYELLSENGARSLAEFNRRLEEGQTLRRAEPVGPEGDPDRWTYTDGPLPYIVLVVDELADLILTVQADVERPLAQLAQKARAIGIHLIVATQRPSVNVITGLIKANFPCRIAFRVSSKVDSRTILDQNGADALLGNGDMLFLPPGQSDPVRIQGAFMPTEDTEHLTRWFADRLAAGPVREEDILEFMRARDAEEAADDLEGLPADRDPLFRQAAEICIQFQQGSTSLLQRRLRIGYGRAARIIDQLHQAGVLGPPEGSKSREVLVGFDSLEMICRDEQG